jgi:3-oxoacyl-(acyl-carrier-protein) synthase
VETPLPIGISASATLSAYGQGVSSIVAGMRAGHAPRRPASGIGFPSDPLPEVSRFPDPFPAGDRGAAQALLQTVQAVLQPTADGWWRHLDCGLILGTGGFLYASGAELYGRAIGTVADDTPFRVRGPNWGAERIVEAFDLHGPVLTLSTGCSSSANALLCATEMLERNEVQRALVVGAEGLSAVTLSGFDGLMLLDPQGCRPFDRERVGLQIGEGIAALVLRCDESAPVRLLGGANLCDTHHLTGAAPDGTGMLAVMREALGVAGVAAEEIVAVKAHATGSRDSDAAEAAALRALFGGKPPPITALKRYLGHTLGACGALETAAFAACLAEGFVPHAAGFTTVDPELGIEPMRAAVPARRGAYLLNFFGFGGNYTSLVLALR